MTAGIDPAVLEWGMFVGVVGGFVIAAALAVAFVSWLVIGVACLYRFIRPTKEVPCQTDLATGSSPSFPPQRSTT